MYNERCEMIQQRDYTPFLLGPEDARRACLLIHGFSGSPAEMRGLGEALAEQGIRVYGMVVKGHSEDVQDLAVSRRKDWIASAENALAQLEHYQQIFLAGLSMGGVLSLILAGRHSDRIAGLVTMSTPTRFS